MADQCALLQVRNENLLWAIENPQLWAALLFLGSFSGALFGCAVWRSLPAFRGIGSLFKAAAKIANATGNANSRLPHHFVCAITSETFQVTRGLIGLPSQLTAEPPPQPS